MAGRRPDAVRLDENRTFGSIQFSDGEVLTGLFWLTRGSGDLQGQLGATLTDGTTFWPLAYVRSFSLQ